LRASSLKALVFRSAINCFVLAGRDI
jgi:hypothetical protein